MAAGAAGRESEQLPAPVLSGGPQGADTLLAPTVTASVTTAPPTSPAVCPNAPATAYATDTVGASTYSVGVVQNATTEATTAELATWYAPLVAKLWPPVASSPPTYTWSAAEAPTGRVKKPEKACDAVPVSTSGSGSVSCGLGTLIPKPSAAPAGRNEKALGMKTGGGAADEDGLWDGEGVAAAETDHDEVGDAAADSVVDA